MKSIGTLTLTGAGTTDTLTRGKLLVSKGKALGGILLKFVVNLANASGGSVTFSDTQRQSFFGGYRMSLSYGKDNKRIPYNSILFTTLQRISRFVVGQDWEGYADSSTGFARSLPNSATTAVTFWAFVPTAYIWHDAKVRRYLAAGRTQAKTMQLDITRVADTCPTGVTVSGNVTATIYPLEISCPEDSWLYLAEWTEADTTDVYAYGPQGLNILSVERTAILTSSSLTNIEAYVGKERLYSGISPNDAYIPTLQIAPSLPAEADVSDRVTPLYQWTQNRLFAELPVGGVTVQQITKDLATFKLGCLTFPIPTDREVREDVQEAAGKTGRNTPLKAVNAAVALSIELPEAHHAYTAMFLYDSTAPEYQRFAGMGSAGDGDEAHPYVPKSVIDNAKAMIADFTVKGEPANAEQVVRRVALAVPGAVQDVEGFDQRGSPVLDQVRGTIG